MLNSRMDCRIKSGNDVSECRSSLLGCLLQALDGLADLWIEPRSAGIQIRKDHLSHPGIPEPFDMLGGAGDRGLIGLAGEELSDLVCHIDKLVGRLLRRRHEAAFSRQCVAGE